MSVNTAFLRMRIRWTTQGTKEIQEAKKKIKASKEELTEMAGMGLELLTVASLSRSVIKDLKDLATGEGGLADIISMATSLIIIYFDILRIQALVMANQRALLMGISPEVAIAGAVALGAAAAVMQGGGRRGPPPSRRSVTERARALGIQ